MHTVSYDYDSDEFSLNLGQKDARELIALLNRAVNTLDPKDWPPWVDNFIKRLEEFTEVSHAKGESL